MPCTTILVGKKASHDGSTIISRNDDGAFSTKHVVIVEPNKQPRKYKSVISKVEVDLPDNPLRYMCTPNVDAKKEGLWPANGINSKNVAMTATETITTNARVLAIDPLVVYKPKDPSIKGSKEVPGGIGEEDIVTLVIPYINSAREGVLRMGFLLEKYGTYECNGMAFSDENEIWWLETIGGHHWIAKKVDDDKVVIMPNQFGMDNFDFKDALGEGKENLCSKDLLQMIEDNNLYLGYDMNHFNPRLAFGSRTDADHCYNTPRAWYIARYFAPRKYKWDGDNADYTPESDDLPWSLVPENKVTVEDVRYLLGSYYQGTKYNPYSHYEDKGKYRSIGVPNSDICGIIQIRDNVPDILKPIFWLSMGGSGFTASVGLYANVDKVPDYIGKTTLETNSNYFYWASRLIAVLVDRDFASALIYDERYTKTVFNKSRELIAKYDLSYAKELEEKVLIKANEDIVNELKKASNSCLKQLLNNSSNKMKTRYNRGDN